MLEFRVLGPLEVWDDERALQLGGPKQRALLALLLLDAGRVVSTDRLIDVLWGEQPPATAATSLQNLVSQLRKLLGAGVLVTKPPGYRLEIEAEQLDLERFRRLVDGARQAPAAERSSKLREAIALWRGAPLADLVSSSPASWKASPTSRVPAQSRSRDWPTAPTGSSSPPTISRRWRRRAPHRGRWTAPRRRAQPWRAATPGRWSRELRFSARDAMDRARQLRFRCAFDSRRLRPCERRITRRISRGQHVLRVKAADRAGNVSRQTIVRIAAR